MFVTDSKFQGEFLDGALTLTYDQMHPMGIVSGWYGSRRCGLRPGLNQPLVFGIFYSFGL